MRILIPLKDMSRQVVVHVSSFPMTGTTMGRLAWLRFCQLLERGDQFPCMCRSRPLKVESSHQVPSCAIKCAQCRLKTVLARSGARSVQARCATLRIGSRSF